MIRKFLFTYTLALVSISLLITGNIMAQNINDIFKETDSLLEKLNDSIIEIRRDLHANPELSNREFKTSEKIENYLKNLGLDVQTGIAHTGVVGILHGTQAKPVVALRADIDALPVTEELDLPFASKVMTEYNGKETGVMHACGHDVHTSILLGVADALCEIKDKIPGTVMFIFQPAEEGAPAGEEGGAKLMLKEGLFDTIKPDAIFGLHTWPGSVGTVLYNDGPFMASADFFTITVKGKGTHGAIPWGGVDPITTASQIVLGLQTIPSRQVDITRGGAVISVGIIQGGTRENIIPDEVVLKGTIRTLNDDTRLAVYDKIKNTATKIAESSGAEALVDINVMYPVTENDKNLANNSAVILQGVEGINKVTKINPVMIAEDFSFYQKIVPGFYFFLGIAPPGSDLSKVEKNHSPRFFVDESAIILGMKSLAHLTLDYLNSY